MVSGQGLVLSELQKLSYSDQRCFITIVLLALALGLLCLLEYVKSFHLPGPLIINARGVTWT